MRQILELLERDARLSPETIATMTGLPLGEVSEAIATWEASGAIRRYKAVVNWDRVDADPTSDAVTAFIDVSIAPARTRQVEILRACSKFLRVSKIVFLFYETFILVY